MPVHAVAHFHHQSKPIASRPISHYLHLALVNNATGSDWRPKPTTTPPCAKHIKGKTAVHIHHHQHTSFLLSLQNVQNHPNNVRKNPPPGPPSPSPRRHHKIPLDHSHPLLMAALHPTNPPLLPRAHISNLLPTPLRTPLRSNSPTHLSTPNPPKAPHPLPRQHILLQRRSHLERYHRHPYRCSYCKNQKPSDSKRCGDGAASSGVSGYAGGYSAGLVLLVSWNCGGEFGVGGAEYFGLGGVSVC